MVIKRGRRRRRHLPNRPPAKSTLDHQQGQNRNAVASGPASTARRYRVTVLTRSCTIFAWQDNLFPTTNINLLHMELSVKRSLLVFLLLLTLLSPSTLSARIVVD